MNLDNRIGIFKNHAKSNIVPKDTKQSGNNRFPIVFFIGLSSVRHSNELKSHLVGKIVTPKCTAQIGEANALLNYATCSIRSTNRVECLIH